METTGRFELPLILPNQAQKHVTHNEALTLIDGLCHLVIKSFSETAPPVTALLDDAFVIASPATGVWFGEEGKIAFNTDVGWRFVAPRQGIIALNATTSKLMIFDQNNWTPLGTVLDITTTSIFGVNTNADTTNRLAVRANAALLTALNVADGGTGDMQVKLNKETAANTASLLYQSGFSGRAEIGLTGDDDLHIKVSANGSTWNDALVINKSTGITTLANNSITNAALADMASARLKGRVAVGTGDPQDITGTQATALLDVFSTSLKGLAPASGGGTANFLRADGTWAAPSAGGSSAWGTISGTLSDQTDLQSALNDKAPIIHSHAQSDITGLSAALAAKSDNSHTHAVTTTAVAGFMSPTDKTKLDGVAPAATANAPDATLLDRANHTGTQASSTISDFSESVDDRVAALLVAGTNISLLYNDAGNALTINAASVPAGASTRIQYNNGGAFGGASRLAVNADGNLMLVTTSSPVTPVANTVQLNARRRAGADFLEVVRPSGRGVPLQSHMGWNKIATWSPLTSTTLSTTGMPRSAVGTASTPALAATNHTTASRRWRMTSAATANSVCDEYSAATLCWRGNASGLGGFLYTSRISLVTLQAGTVAFFGLMASTAALSTTQTIAALVNCVGIGFTNGTNTNWQLIFNDGTATPSQTDMGANFPVSSTTNLYSIMIYAAPNSANIGVRVTCENTGAVFEQDLTTKIPANTTFMSVRNFMHNGGVVAAVAYECSGVYVESEI